MAARLATSASSAAFLSANAASRRSLVSPSSPFSRARSATACAKAFCRSLPALADRRGGNDLQKAFAQADADRARLKGELGETSKRLVASRAAIDRLHADVASAVDSLPPDPRGGAVEVRAAQFTTKGGLFAYDVVLTRSRDTAKPIAGVLQFSLAGESARGGETTAALKPVELSIGSHQVLRGSLPLPEGFRPRQTTVQVLDRVGGKALGMRVMQVQSR